MAATITQIYQEYKFGIEFGRLKIIIPTADVLTSGTQIAIISAAGSGKVIEVTDSSLAILTYGGTAYTTHTTVQLITDTAATGQFIGVNFLTRTVVASTFLTRNIIGTAATDTQLIANKGLYFVVSSGNPAAGNSDIILYIDYKIYTQ